MCSALVVSFVSALSDGCIARLTEHDDVIKPRLRGAPHLGLPLGPAPARAGPDCSTPIARQTDPFIRIASCHETECLTAGTVAPADLLSPESWQ